MGMPLSHASASFGESCSDSCCCVLRKHSQSEDPNRERIEPAPVQMPAGSCNSNCNSDISNGGHHAGHFGCEILAEFKCVYNRNAVVGLVKKKKKKKKSTRVDTTA